MELSTGLGSLLLIIKILHKKSRILLFILLAMLALLAIALPSYVNHWRQSSTINTFESFQASPNLSFSKIIWKSDYLGDQLIEKIAFYIPIRMEGIEEKLYMQFDSGTQKTLLYGKTLNQLEKSTRFQENIQEKNGRRFASSVQLQMADNRFEASEIRIASTLGEDTLDTSFIVIGTMGFDAFVDRTLILDFKNDQLAITDQASSDLEFNLEKIRGASVNKFPLLIPAKIGTKKTKLFYDTGSSMFSIITSNKRLKKVNKHQTDTLCCISNWGRQLPVHKKLLDKEIQIGKQVFSHASIYGCEVLDMVNYVPSWYLYGMTGNRLFDQTIVVIDTKNNSFSLEY